MQSGRNYLITGATGNVGKRVAEQLLSQGHRVRVFGRNRERLQQLVDMGATPFIGDMWDKESVNEAFRGVDAALLIRRLFQDEFRDKIFVMKFFNRLVVK